MKKRLINLFLVLLGTFILAMSVEMFILPYKILSGGVAGIAVALEPFFHINETLFANTAMVVLFVLGAIVMGKEFAAHTVVSTLAYPLFTSFLAKHPIAIDVDPVLASFYAGLLGGFGIGLVMKTGASTGGMDIPPLILHKLTGVKISTLVMITDALTVALGIIAFDINAALIGLISVFSSGLAIDKALAIGQSSSKAVQIVSDHWQKIRQGIDEELERGCTLLDAQGGYQMAEKKVVLCVVANSEYAKLIDMVKRIDDHAFVITTEATDMHGEGFTYSSPNI